MSSIQSYQSRGYSPAQIRQGLISQGWPVQEVDEAFASLQPAGYRRWMVVAGVSIAFLALVAASVLFLVPSRPSQLLDVSVDPLSSEVIAGSPAEFIVQLVNLGSARRFDVHIVSELVSVASNEVVSSKTETVAIETRNAVKSQVVVPSAAKPGRYVVRVLVEYEDQSARASFSLVVSAASSVSSAAGPARSAECPAGCNDYDACTIDRCVSGRCVFERLAPCCGNGVCESSESEAFCPEDCGQRRSVFEDSVQTIMDKAFDAARSDPASGVRVCRTLTQVSDQGSCLSGVAKRANQPDICGQIIQAKEKDGCYLDFALGKDRFDLCDLLQDRWLKSSCYSYSNLKKAGR